MQTAFEVWLKRKLRLLGMNKGKLARELDYDPSTVTKWCKNPSRISRTVLQAIAGKLGVDVNDIPLGSTLPSETEETPRERIRIYGVNDGIPDHCLVQLAAYNFFRREGLDYVDFRPQRET